MLSIVAGDGAMGRAVASALAGRGTPPLAILGMPGSPDGHAPKDFHGAEVLFEFTVGDAVLQNVKAALAGGVRCLVIGTTSWAGDRERVEALLAEHNAAAVASANFSLGVALFAAYSVHLKKDIGRSPVRNRHRAVAAAHRRPPPQDARGPADGPWRTGRGGARRLGHPGRLGTGHAPRRLRRPR